MIPVMKIEVRVPVSSVGLVARIIATSFVNTGAEQA
jgi:hypothetical protein